MEMTVGKRGVMAAGTILIIVLIGFAKANHGNDTIVEEEGGSRRSLQTLGFLGCYLGCGKFEFSMSRKDLINVRCLDYCADKAEIYAVTRGDFCGCTSSLEYLKPIVQPLNTDSSDLGVTGQGTPCDMACTGSWAGKEKKQCTTEACCGGRKAYSVFGAGKIPLEKQLAKRLMRSIKLRELKAVTRNAQQSDIDNVRIKFVLKPSGTTQQKVCTTTTTSLECESLNEGSAPPVQPLKLTVVKFERDTIYSMPHDSKPIEGFSTGIDTSKAGGAGGKLTQTYTVADTNSYTAIITGGFDLSLEISNTVTIFGVAENTVTAGYTGHFSRSAENTHSVTTSNTVTVEVTVPKGSTGGTVTMMKDYTQLSVAWRANTRVSGKVRVFLGSNYKDFQLTELFSKQDKTFFTGGMAEYGEQIRITALVKDAGNSSPLPVKTLTVKTDPEAVVDKGAKKIKTSDLPTRAGDTEDSITISECGDQMSSQYMKAGGIIKVSVQDDKMVECETDFQKETDVCFLSCKDTTDEALYLFSGRERRSTKALWSGDGSRLQSNGINEIGGLDTTACVAIENLATNKHAAVKNCLKAGYCKFPNYCCASRITDGVIDGITKPAGNPLITAKGWVTVEIGRWAYIHMVKLFVPSTKTVLGHTKNVKVYTYRDQTNMDYTYKLCKSIDNGAWTFKSGQTNGITEVAAYCPEGRKGTWVKVINNDKKSELRLLEFQVFGQYVTDRRCQRPNCCTRSQKCENDEGYCDDDYQCISSICGQPGSCHWGGDLTTRCCQIKNRCNGKDTDCCTAERPCLVGDGDCDYDYQCVGNMVCGHNNCVSDQQTPTDDCCKPP